MAAATDDAAAVTTDFVDLDFNIDDFDVRDFDDFDFDLAADELCDAYSSFVASADANKIVGGGGGAATGGGWLAGLCGDGEGRSREGSPDSGVTDGPLVGDEAMSAYAAELERFLMEDGDAEEVLCPDGDGERVEELICADDFFGDMLARDFNGIVTVAEENGDDVLAAREDEPASRKRARHKIKGTTMMPWSGELEVARRHLARIPAPWPLAGAVFLCCR